MNKKLWKICNSNARAAVQANGSKPQRIYPYCGVEFVGSEKQEVQAYWNECAKWSLEFAGGVWKE